MFKLFLQTKRTACSDIVAFSGARTHLSDLVLEVENGAEKIIAKNGEPVVAMIDAQRLEHRSLLDRERISAGLRCDYILATQHKTLYRWLHELKK
ncbi:MAG: type II toxin-antitoxin system prevent-host-death family antitoxin [Rhodoferax sp.]|nr:type II toxin-antitoxin system prevent-host-death family antitoxin [Rhodoferax sp.]